LFRSFLFSRRSSRKARRWANLSAVSPGAWVRSLDILLQRSTPSCPSCNAYAEDDMLTPTGYLPPTQQPTRPTAHTASTAAMPRYPRVEDKSPQCLYIYTYVYICIVYICILICGPGVCPPGSRDQRRLALARRLVHL